LFDISTHPTRFKQTSMSGEKRVTGPNCMEKLPSNLLKLLSPVFGKVDNVSLEGTSILRIKNNRKDATGKDVSGFFVVSRVKQAVLPMHPFTVNIKIAPSLGFVDNGKGKQIAVVNLQDLVKLFEHHWQTQIAVPDDLISSVSKGSIGGNVTNANSTVVDKQRMKKVSAVVLKELVELEKLDSANLHGNSLRKVSGQFVLVDVVAAVLFNGNLISARQWLVNNNDTIVGVALSLSHVANGHSSVSIFHLL